MRKPKVGTEMIEGLCTGLDADGRGVVQTEGLSLSVFNLLPDERARLAIVHRSPHGLHGIGEVRSRLNDSVDRTAPACAAFGQCGGCTLEHLNYPAQLRWKQAQLQQVLGGIAATANIPIAPIVASPRPLGYRNRAKWVFGRDAVTGQNVLGAYAPRSHRVVSQAGCAVTEAPLETLAQQLIGWLRELEVQPFDESTQLGDLRYVVARSNERGEVLVLLVTRSRDLPAKGALLERFAQLPNLVGVSQNIQSSRSDFLFGEDELLWSGQSQFTEHFGTVALQLSVRSFSQVNRDIAGRIYADTLAAVAPRSTDVVADVFAGTGALSKMFSPHVKSAVAIESYSPAATDGAAQAPANVTFQHLDALVGLQGLTQPNVILLNPPRRGCDPSVLQAATAHQPRTLAYLSCNPESLARDLGLLLSAGRTLRSLQPYDMLPQTPHAEILAVLG